MEERREWGNGDDDGMRFNNGEMNKEERKEKITRFAPPLHIPCSSVGRVRQGQITL